MRDFFRTVKGKVTAAVAAAVAGAYYFWDTVGQWFGGFFG